MSLKLQIPQKDNRKVIEKVYETDELYIPFELIINVLEQLDIEGDKTELGMVILKNLKVLKPLTLEIFEGLTAEELGRVNSFDLVDLFFEILIYAKEQMSVKLKNAVAGLNKKK